MLTYTILVHRGQEVTATGEVVGPEPRTETFGLRWSAFDNPFVSTGRLGQDEWHARKAVNQDSAEKAACQFIWAIPHEPPDVDLTQLEPDEVAQRQHATKKGIVPPDCLGVVVGGDTGKRHLHWSAHAILADGSDVVIEYGVQPVAWEKMGVTESLLAAFDELRRYWSGGWLDETGKRWQPSVVWCDSGWSEHQAAVYAFCRAAGHSVYYPVKGNGQNVYGRNEGYHAPKSLSDTVRYIGRGMHTSWQAAHAVHLVLLDSDAWRSEFQARLKLDPSAPGAIRLYSVADPVEHADWSNHVTADRLIDVFEAGRRVGVKWTQIRKANHWGDAGYYGTAAGQFLRDMLAAAAAKKTAATNQHRQQVERPSGGQSWIPTR